MGHGVSRSLSATVHPTGLPQTTSSVNFPRPEGPLEPDAVIAPSSSDGSSMITETLTETYLQPFDKMCWGSNRSVDDVSSFSAPSSPGRRHLQRDSNQHSSGHLFPISPITSPPRLQKCNVLSKRPSRDALYQTSPPSSSAPSSPRSPAMPASAMTKQHDARYCAFDMVSAVSPFAEPSSFRVRRCVCSTAWSLLGRVNRRR